VTPAEGYSGDRGWGCSTRWRLERADRITSATTSTLTIDVSARIIDEA
jgi:hypothetical protein